MLSFAQLRELQPGGTVDTLALLALAAGGMATHPMFGGLSATAIAAAAGIAAAGGAWWGHRIWKALGPETLEGSQLRIRSSKPPRVTPDGMHLGYIVDTGEPLVIPMADWVRHAMIVGQSGVGKTVLGNWIMMQQIERGGGLLWIDGKLDPDNFAGLYAMCAHAGRLDDLRIISPGTPEFSNTYNPVLFGDPDEVAARLLATIPSSEGNAGTDYYRQAANQGLTVLTQAVQATGLAYNCADLAVLLMNPLAMRELEDTLTDGSEAKHALRVFLHQFRVPMKPGMPATEIDVKKLKDTFGGMGGRLNTFGSGKFGKVLNAYSPEVRLTEDMMANRIIYVALPTMGKQEAASNFGKLIIGDLRTAISKIQELPVQMRPNPSFICFCDEAGSYMTQAFSRIFEQARSARVVAIPAFQTKANLEEISAELRAMVSGNTLTKIFFKPGEDDTGEWMSDMIGTEFRTVYSISASRGIGISKKSAFITASPAGESDSGATAFSESNEEMHRITGSELKRLGKGEAIVTFDGSKVYHIRIPITRFDKRFLDAIGPPALTHRRVKRARGLDYAKNPKFTGVVPMRGDDDA
jgi:hypothetical protein